MDKCDNLPLIDGGFLDCDCWKKLTRVLSESDLLPDHAGQATRQYTVEDWVRRHFAADRQHPPFRIVLSNGQRVTAPYIEARENHIIERKLLSDWALPLYESKDKVVLIIRQSVIEDVQDNADPKRMKKLIESNSRWKPAIKRIQAEVEITDRLRDIGLASGIGCDMHSETFFDLQLLLSMTQVILRAMGLPDTPETTMYAFNKAHPNYPHYSDFVAPITPTYGIIVESVCIAPDPSDFDGQASIISNYVGQAPTDKLLRRAAKIQLSHKKWWSKQNDSTMPLRTQGRPKKMDQLKVDISRFQRGELTKQDVINAALNREDAKYQRKGATGAPGEVRVKLKKNVVARLRRSTQSE